MEGWAGLVEMLLFFGVVLGWAGREWWKARQWRRERDAARSADPAAPRDDR